jgi:hypothetical protein
MMGLLGLAGVWEFWGIVQKVSPNRSLLKNTESLGEPADDIPDDLPV